MGPVFEQCCMPFKGHYSVTFVVGKNLTNQMAQILDTVDSHNQFHILKYRLLGLHFKIEINEITGVNQKEVLLSSDLKPD